MESGTPQVSATQKVQPEVKEVSQVPQQSSTGFQATSKPTSPANLKK